MNREFVTSPADITKLAVVIMTADQGAATGRATYLRSLLAGTQEALAGKPIQRVTGRPKRPEIEAALAAFEKINETFYNAVLAAVPTELKPDERQSKTSFARSASATLRGAIRTGWNPLSVAVSGVSKGALAAWKTEHSAPRPLTAGAAEKRVVSLLERVEEILAAIPRDDALRIRATLLEQPPQRLTNVSLRRQETRPAAH